MWLDEDEIQLRRDKIIETAFDLFCEKGIERVSMGNIADQSGVGKRTMYRYFNNKMDLVIQVMFYKWITLIEGIRKKIQLQADYESLTGYQQLYLWLDTFRQVYENSSPLFLFSYEVKLNLMRNRIRLTEEQQEAIACGIRGPCIDALEKGKADGTLSFPYKSIEVFYAMWASIRGCIALCGENSPCKNTYLVMEETILNALHSK